MSGCFSIMTEHLEEDRPDTAGGRVVLSRLGPGASPLGSQAPSVKMVLDGEARFQVGGRDWRVEPGQWLYLDGSQPCWGITKTHSTAVCVLLPGETGRDGDAPEEVEPMTGGAVLLSSSTSAAGRAIGAAARRIATTAGDAERRARALLALVARAIREPVGESRAAMEGLGVAKAATRRDLFQRLERARSHLHVHAGRIVTLTELAQVAGLSQFHLARFFKLAFGQAPMAYHRALRLEQGAKILMAMNDAPLAEVAIKAGYSDEVAFSHAFRRHFGASPRRWARTHRVA